MVQEIQIKLEPITVKFPNSWIQAIPLSQRKSTKAKVTT